VPDIEVDPDSGSQPQNHAKGREIFKARNQNRLWLFKFRVLSRDFAVRHPVEKLLPVR
jgi:hypothetical protein